MADLIIKRSDSIGDFEQYLSLRSPSVSDLLIPNELDDGGALGTSIAFTQFLLTWMRNSPSGILKTYLSLGDIDAYTKFTARTHGLAAAYFSNELLGDRGNGSNIRWDVLSSAKARIEAMHNGILNQTCRGQEIEFIFVQGAKKEFHGSLYTKIPTEGELADRQAHGELIRSSSELTRFMSGCFEHLNIKKTVLQYLTQIDSPFGTLLTEIFRNTAEHAYLQVDGRKYQQNLRSIRIAISELDRDKLSIQSVSSPETRKTADSYFSTISKRPGKFSRKKIQLLEFSIFDSGPGFAATVNQNNRLSTDSETASVAKCFQIRSSAKRFPAPGFGLSKVLDAIQQLSGFLRLRTGTVEAFYGAQEDLILGNTPPITVNGSLAKTEGSAITIGIPITY